MATNRKNNARNGTGNRDRVGAGDETHPVASTSERRLTTSHGAPVAEDQSTLRVGERGPALLEDFHFRDKIFHVDHERIPERVVHARGYGAHGYLVDDGHVDLTHLGGTKRFVESCRRLRHWGRA